MKFAMRACNYIKRPKSVCFFLELSNSFTVNLEVTEGNQENDIVKELEVLKGTMR